MSFLSAGWLLLLIPWAGLAIYLLRGVPPKAGVPFLSLWPGDVAPPTRDRRWRSPPLRILLLLVAMFLAIFGASGPRLPRGGTISGAVIVDRGLSMSALDGKGRRRFVGAAEETADIMKRAGVEVGGQVESIPPTAASSSGAWMEATKLLNPTAVDTRNEIYPAVREALRSSGGLVILLTDQPPEIHDPRLVVISPKSKVRNVAIAKLAVRVDPPQAMIAIANNSDDADATLNVTTDGRNVSSQKLTLPPRGQRKNYFVDLPAGSKVVSAAIDCADDLDLNHRAWVVRRDAWPIVEARSALPPELGRMIEVYARHRPAGEDSVHVAVMRGVGSIPDNMPAAVVEDGTEILAVLGPVEVEGPLQFPGVDWQSALAGASVAKAPPGWQPAVLAGGRTVVAIQSDKTRRAWVGISSDIFPREAGFVVFWTEIFDWLGGGVPEFASSPPAPLSENWRRVDPSTPTDEPGLAAGLYENDRGRMLAVNAGLPAVTEPAPAESEESILSVLQSALHYTMPGPYLLLAAIGLSALALMCWPAVAMSANRANNRTNDASIRVKS
jgi:hypothetical protein